MNYVVELTGIPGSGKTFLSNQLFDCLSSDKKMSSFTFHNRRTIYYERNEHGLRKLLSTLSLLFNHLYLKLFLLLLFSPKYKRERKPKLKYLIKILLQQRFVTKKTKNCDNNVFIIDEGFIHLQYIFLENMHSSSSLQKHMVLLTKMLSQYRNTFFVTFFVECDVKKAFERIQSRDQGWPIGFLGKTDSDKINYLMKQFSVFNYLNSNLSCEHSETMNSYELEKALKYIAISLGAKHI